MQVTNMIKQHKNQKYGISKKRGRKIKNGKGRKNNVLWFGNAKKHITFMFYLWACFPEDSRPEWLTFGDLMYYEKEIEKE